MIFINRLTKRAKELAEKTLKLFPEHADATELFQYLSSANGQSGRTKGN